MSNIDKLTYNATSINVTFSYTKPGTPFNTKSSGIYISKWGVVTGGTDGDTSINIVLEGGDDVSPFEKSGMEPMAFTLTSSQKNILYILFKTAADGASHTKIDSDNGDLLELCTSIYYNFGGI